jgi:hypothetical protein
LLNVSEDQHMRLIEEAAGKEEVLLDPNAIVKAVPAGNMGSETSAPKASVAFAYKADSKGISVPSFKWKSKDGHEKLQSYAEALRKLLDEVEERLTSPAAGPNA